MKIFISIISPIIIILSIEIIYNIYLKLTEKRRKSNIELLQYNNINNIPNLNSSTKKEIFRIIKILNTEKDITKKLDKSSLSIIYGKKSYDYFGQSKVYYKDKEEKIACIHDGFLIDDQLGDE